MAAGEATHYPQPRAAAIAVTFRGDELILIRRRNEPQRGAWGFPGGSIRPGESIHDATLRELEEETGVAGEVLGLLDVVEVREQEAGGQRHHYILIAMLCRYLCGELRAGDDALDCRWVRIPKGLENFQGTLVDHAARVATAGHLRWRSIQGGDST